VDKEAMAATRNSEITSSLAEAVEAKAQRAELRLESLELGEAVGALLLQEPKGLALPMLLAASRAVIRQQ
jgi:hypothetical protein